MKNKKNIFNNLRFNRCLLRLDESEEKFLRYHLSIEKDLKIEKIMSVLKELNSKSEIRYFNDDQVYFIAKDLRERINEEVARNFHTVSYTSVPELIKRSINICTVSGKYIVTAGAEEVYFEDEDSAILYAKNNKFY